MTDVRVTVNLVTDNGATCTALPERNQKIDNGTVADGQAAHGCTTDPTLNGVWAEIMVRNFETRVIDLRGIVANANTEDGIMIRTVVASAGVVNATLIWYER